MTALIRRVTGGFVVEWGPNGFEHTAVATDLPGLLVTVEAVFGEKDARGEQSDGETEQ